MAKKFVKKKIKIPIYDANLWVVVHDDLEKGIAMLPRCLDIDATEDDKDVQAICYSDFPHYGIAFDYNSLSPGIIHHEVAHVVRDIMHAIGFTIDPQNDEPVSYFEQWLNDKVTDIVLR